MNFKNYLKRGDEIICSNNHLIAISKADVNTGDIIKTEYFDWKQTNYKNGEKAKPCEICNEKWYKILSSDNVVLLVRMNPPDPLPH